MRQFSTEYLDATRRGMWEDRTALEGLDLRDCDRILDVGCGTGVLTGVLAEETGGRVVGLDADGDLLSVARTRTGLPMLAGDATRLPFPDGTFDLVVCQALLINLPDPVGTVEEFARVSRDRVAAVEPDNAAVTVESSVDSEPRLERRAREAYLAGVPTDVTLGGQGVRDAFEEAGLADVRTRRYDHVKVVDPPYDEEALADARRKATGTGLAEDRGTLEDELSPEEYEDLRADWREMGRSVVDQMRTGTYRREETVPFFVTVGRV